VRSKGPAPVKKPTSKKTPPTPKASKQTSKAKASNTAKAPAQSTAKATVGKPWVKGQSGNPGGRARIPAELIAAAKAMSMDALGVLESIMHDPKAMESARVKAATAIIDRAYGKPAQAVSITDPEGNPLSSILVMNREERDRRIAELIGKGGA
jgi:hypothetical protein